MPLSQPLHDQIIEYCVSVPLLRDHEALRQSAMISIERSLSDWDVPLCTLIRELDLSTDKAMARLLAAWFLLQYFGTRLDTIMDDDTDPPELAWQGIDKSEGALVGISGIVGAITLGLEGRDLRLNRALSHILRAVQDCIVGQMMDLRGVRSLTEYERAVQLKTGSPLRALLSALASLGDTPPAIELGLAEFGMALGMMKQLNNDVAAIWGERSSNDSDLQKRQLTYPMLFMLEGNHSSATKAAFARLLQEMPGQRDVEQMKQLLESASTVRFINIALIAYARQASDALQVISEEARQQLMEWLRATMMNQVDRETMATIARL